MKLLFDQNLSPRLVQQLADLFPDSAHVQTLALDKAPDTPLWDFARDNGFAIVSKDVDFSDRCALVGFPPKVIWIRLGNCTTSAIESAIRKHYDQIAMFGKNEELGVFAIIG